MNWFYIFLTSCNIFENIGITIKIISLTKSIENNGARTLRTVEFLLHCKITVILIQMIYHFIDIHLEDRSVCDLFIDPPTQRILYGSEN